MATRRTGGTKKRNMRNMRKRMTRRGGARTVANPGLKLEKAAAASTKKLGRVQKRVATARTRVNTLQVQITKAKSTLTKSQRDLEEVENKDQIAQKVYNEHRGARKFSPKVRLIRSPNTL